MDRNTDKDEFKMTEIPSEHNENRLPPRVRSRCASETKHGSVRKHTSKKKHEKELKYANEMKHRSATMHSDKRSLPDGTKHANETRHGDRTKHGSKTRHEIDLDLQSVNERENETFARGLQAST